MNYTDSLFFKSCHNLSMHCKYFMVVHHASDESSGGIEYIDAWKEWFKFHHIIEPFDSGEYRKGTYADSLWMDVYDESLHNKADCNVYFDYIYFGM